MARRAKPSETPPPAADAPDRVLANEEIVRLHGEAVKFCLLDPRRKKSEPESRCIERRFSTALDAAWKKAPRAQRPRASGPRRFEVRCFDAATKTPVGEPEARASRSTALALAKKAVQDAPHAFCLVVPVLRRGRAAVVGASTPSVPPLGKVEPGMVIESEAVEVGSDEEVHPPQADVPLLPAPVLAPVPPSAAPAKSAAVSKTRRPFAFYRFDTKDGSFGSGHRDYFTAGQARAAFRAMTGPTEGYVVLGEDGSKMFFAGACVNRARAPSEFHDVMRRAQVAWKDATLVGDPRECGDAAQEPEAAAPEAGSEAAPEDEEGAWTDITPTATSPAELSRHAYAWMAARPGALVAQGVADEESDEESHDAAFFEAKALLTSDGVLVVRPAAGRKGYVTVRKGPAFDEAKLGADAKALLRAWSIDTNASSVEVDVDTPEPPAPVDVPSDAVVAVAVVQALVAEGVTLPAAPAIVQAPQAVAPFVAKSGWEALATAMAKSAKDPDQAAIVVWQPAPGKHLRIQAGAGAGKTATLTTWIARLLHNGLDPRSIVVTTFTNRGGKELEDRLKKVVPADVFKRIAGIGTFDSLAARAFKGRLGGWQNQDGKEFEGLGPDQMWKSVLGWGWIPRSLGLGPADRAAIRQKRLVHGTDVEGLAVEFPEDGGINAGVIKQGVQILRARGIVPGGPGYAEAIAALPGEPYLHSKALGRLAALRDLIDRAWRATEDVKRQLGLYDFVDLEMRWLAERRARPQPPRLVFVDEAQDNSLVQLDVARALSSAGSLVLIGDARQCIPADEPVATPRGPVPIGTVRPGDEVLASVGGCLLPRRVLRVSCTTKAEAFRFTTETGSTFRATAEHVLFAALGPPAGWYVYLMFRRGFGFRIGVSQSSGTQGMRSIEMRTRQEAAERLWILAHCCDKGEAHRIEHTLSLRYAVPQEPFKPRPGAFGDPSATRALFTEFGDNGARLLADRGLDFRLPSYVAKSSNRGCIAVNLSVGAEHGATVGVEAADVPVEARTLFTFTSGRRGTWRLRRWFADPREAEELAHDVADACGGYVVTTLSLPGAKRRVHAVRAAGVFPGALVPEADAEGHVRLVRVETRTAAQAGECCDLEVQGAVNFVVGRTVVHNSIFPWRGAFPKFFREADRILGAQTLEIRSNYRSARAVVSAANVFARGRSWNPGSDQIAKRPLEGSVVVRGFHGGGETAQAQWIAADIKARWDRDGTLSYNAGDGTRKSRFAVLYATNAEALPLQLALLNAKIPVAVVGGKFFSSKAAKTFSAYAKTATTRREPDWEAFREMLRLPKRRYVNEDDFIALVRAAYSGDLSAAVRAAIHEVKGPGARESLGEFARDLADLRTTPWPQMPTRIAAILAPVFQDLMEESGEPIDVSTAGEVEVGGDAGDADDADEKPQIGLDPTLSALASLAAKFKSFDSGADSFITFTHKCEDEKNVTSINTDNVEPPADRVLLSTVYKAKGLEWPVVYLLATNGKLPWSVREEIVDADRPDTFERLFYVGATRAMEELVCCWWSAGEPPRVRGGPSPFLARMGLAP